jgi:uncharacterized protein YyaL (SSP411 family)
MNLLMLSHLVENPTWSRQVERTLRAFGDRLAKAGRGVPMMAAALSMYTAGIQQIVVAEGPPDDRDRELGGAVARRYLPFAIQLHVSAERRQRVAGSLPLVGAMEPVEGKTAIYVCRDFSCRAPATTVQELDEALTS